MAHRLLGPATPVGVGDHTGGDGITFIDHGDRLELRATVDLEGVASGSFSRPRFGAAFSPEGFTGADVAFVGFACTQFALPVRAEPGGRFEFRPAHNLSSPPVVLPLLCFSADGRVELLAPLDAWHEQIVAVHQDDERITGFTWGWHGHLDVVPAGTTATLGIFTGTSAAEVLARWGERVRDEVGAQARPSDPLLTHLSYWTDNGAAYWYRTEPGRDLTDTLTDKIAELDALGVPVRSVELDSWFYPHETTRSVSETGYLETVPPTGMLSWTPRSDVVPSGIEPLRRALGESPAGDRPLVLHSRHISPASPYLAEGDWWVDDLAAHPADPAFFDRWCADAARWGATCIEQDWMMMTYFGVTQMRAEPGRALAWQRGLDAAAARHDLTLLWCMALPGDYVAAAGLERVVAVRTCDDYRFAEDPALLWVWYLTLNALADVLGLAVFKDCFFSATPPVSDEVAADPTDGDPHAELEAALAALGGGPVGVGDRLGRTDAAILRRVCRPDGRLVGPDRPIRLSDASMVDAGRTAGLCWAETSSTNPLGTWRYVLAINTSTDRSTRRDRFDLGDTMVVHDWRAGTAAPTSELEVELAARDWALFVCCPSDGSAAVPIGDPSVYATMAPTRVEVSGDDIVVISVAGEEPTPVRWWYPPDRSVDP